LLTAIDWHLLATLAAPAVAVAGGIWREAGKWVSLSSKIETLKKELDTLKAETIWNSRAVAGLYPKYGREPSVPPPRKRLPTLSEPDEPFDWSAVTEAASATLPSPPPESEPEPDK
jgi:hypothetical protein